MRKLAKMRSWISLVALAASGVTACSATPTSERTSRPAKAESATGTIGLSLQPVSGVTLNSLHFVVTKAGVATPVLEGDLPTPGSAKTITLSLPVPTGTGYTLSLSGVSVENANIGCSGSFGSFDVLANASTNLNVVLFCADRGQGSVFGRIVVETDACPRLIVSYVVASPSVALSPGGTIALSGAAVDLDGKAVQYSWRVSNPQVGSFAPANGSSSTFTCLSRGSTVDLTLTANNGECATSLATTVSCSDGGECGNGVLDPGEACDPSIPGSSADCLPNCTRAVCGNGVVEAPAEECDPVPPDPRHCTATCQRHIIECGDGFLDPLEPCDGTLFPVGTPPGAQCGPDCTLVDPHCGNGILEQGEVCDPPFTRNDCSSICQHITSASCLACENATSPGASAPNCTDFSDCGAAVGNAAAGSPAAGTTRSFLCNETLDCVRRSGCAAGGKAPISCYCGTASGPNCQAGLGNGACKTQIERSLEATSFAQIAARIGDVSFGGGIAMGRIDCDQTFCTAECGL